MQDVPRNFPITAQKSELIEVIYDTSKKWTLNQGALKLLPPLPLFLECTRGIPNGVAFGHSRGLASMLHSSATERFTDTYNPTLPLRLSIRWPSIIARVLKGA